MEVDLEAGAGNDMDSSFKTPVKSQRTVWDRREKYQEKNIDNVSLKAQPVHSHIQTQEALDHESDEYSNADKDEEEDRKEPMVSILNLVVDHVMMTPSPLEPDEFQWKYFPQKLQMQNGDDRMNFDLSSEMGMRMEGEEEDLEMEVASVDVKVPVVRIFGPIVRRSGMPLPSPQATTREKYQDQSRGMPKEQSKEGSSTSTTTKIHQSGCLHIHGAFPYMLARPLEAGADASSSFYNAYNLLKHTKGSENGCTDHRYNNHRIIGEEGESCGDAEHDDRDLVVDWDDEESVKLVTDEIHLKLEQALRSHLEQGYGSGGDVEGNSGDGGASSNDNRRATNEANMDMAPTRFIRQVTVVCGRGFYTFCNGGIAPFLRIEYYDPGHRWRVKIMLERGLEMPLCYHPKEMSDDTNADAGRRSNGNIEEARGSLDVDLLKFRCYEAHIPYTMQLFKDWNLSGMSWINVGDCRFRNPIQRILKDRCGNRGLFQHDSNLGSDFLLGDHAMTHDTIPSKLHWNYRDDDENEVKKTLPKEVWTNKETSCDIELDTTVSNLLNVHDVMKTRSEDPEVHWRAVPSLREIWAEERKRMAHLLPPRENFLSEEKEDVVPSFTLSVKKGADKPGSRLALEGSRRLFNSSPGLLESFRKAMSDIVQKHAGPLSGIDEKMKSVAVRARQKNSLQISPSSKKYFQSSQDEALAALESLMNQFIPESSNNRSSQLSLSQKSPMAWSQNLSQSAIQPLTQDDLREVEDSLEYCRNLERCNDSDSMIDPSTLTPYVDEAENDFLHEEENMGEKEFEKCLTMLATQDHASMVRSAMTFHSDSPDSCQPKMSCNEDSALCEDSLCGINSDTEFSQRSDQIVSNPSHETKTVGVLDNKNRCKNSIFLSSESSICETGNFLYLKKSPPLREALLRSHIQYGSGNVLRHPYSHSLNSKVPWLGYASISCSSKINDSSPDIGNRCEYFEPTRKPPSTWHVRRWIQKDRKNSSLSGHKLAKKEVEEHQQTALSQHTSSCLSAESLEVDALGGIGQQGGKFFVEGGGTLKTSLVPSDITPPNACPRTQVTIMSIEVHVQCRVGRAGVNNSREIAMKPDPSRDSISAVCFVYGYDPGGGEKIEILERASVFVPTEIEISSYRRSCDSDDMRKSVLSSVGKTMGCSKDIKFEVVESERHLLLRFASMVRLRDPDTLISWDTQGLGIGYLIDRGLTLGNKENETAGIDMVRLLGRTPKHNQSKVEEDSYDCLFDESINNNDGNKGGHTRNRKNWVGSGLGAEWDDRVGAGSGPSSIVGRLVLNCRKIMSDEVKHPNSSYQPAMVSTVLKRRIPFHDDLILTRWYGGHKGSERWRVLRHRILQALANIKLFDALDVIGRAGEAARLSGVELSQSFPGIRGSQYKVEGVLLRALQSLCSDERGEKRGNRQVSSSLSNSSQVSASQSQSPWKVRRNSTKELLKNNSDRINQRGYFFFSPSKRDAAAQEALECQAMTLEPESGFHFDPVVVCDFTALYPSLIIAYNLCYSTCAGKLEYHSTREEMRQMGKTTSKLGPFQYPESQTAYTLKQHVKSISDSNFAQSTDRAYCLPTGSMFVSERVLRGVLPSVLDEILATRAMLKKAAKQYKRLLAKPPKAVLRQLEARQLALKYVANVTYGYTSATFSGRSAMPLLADSIVECGRRTLTNAILLAKKWGDDKNSLWSGAHVIYGDTDSIFVKLPGRTVKEAWAFGKEFCDKVTASNPPPVQLKLEKVYLGTLLQTKKKYCGMKFDSPDQQIPTFEGKGIETVRKDQCALTQKLLRESLVKIFKGESLDNLKHFLFRQWALVHAGRFPVSDFILTGRVRSHYRGKVGPVQSALAKRLAEADPGRTVRHKERLPYVIVATPGRNFKLRDCVLTPDELLAQWDAYTVHSHYYATKHLNAALNRCFSLQPFKVDINVWYQAAPKPQKRIHHWPITRAGNSAMISSYFGSDICAICSKKSKAEGASKAVICHSCRNSSNITSYLALESLNQVQKKGEMLASICQQCNGCVENTGTYASEKRIPKNNQPSNLSKRKRQTGSSSAVVVAPISICTCIDCPVTYRRHTARESEIETLDLCDALRCTR